MEIKSFQGCELMLRNFKGYTVSSNGTVYSKKNGKEMETRVRKGYREVYLYVDEKYQWFLMHRLIAMVFLPNPDNKPEVHHIDENKLNNDISNLMWVTKSENKAYSVGQPVIGISRESGLIMEYYCMRDAQRATGVQHCQIKKQCENPNRKLQSRTKYIWMYKEV